MDKPLDWQSRLDFVIPGGAHTYSRGVDQYPPNAPPILKRGKGAYVWTPEREKFLDLGMALRSTALGYAFKKVDSEAIKYLKYGNNLSKPSVIELELAEYLLNLITGMEMVKFAKHGSSVTTAACRIARSFTGKTYICVPRQQPFFAFEDWFIGTTPVNKGIPKEYSSFTLFFDYNNIESLRDLFQKHPNQIAAVMLEPATQLVPTDCACLTSGIKETSILCEGCKSNNFLKDVRLLCDSENALLILDEMRTGFRWNLRGAQNMFGVIPDLGTFGKAMANGYSVSALMGKRDVMSVAATNTPGSQRTFLLSSTHGAEMGPLAAAKATLEVMESKNVSQYLWRTSSRLVLKLRELIGNHSLSSYIILDGTPLSLEFTCLDVHHNPSLHLKTLLFQEVTKRKILISNGNSISLSYSHKDRELQKVFLAFDESFSIYRRALESDPKDYLNIIPMKPVFRSFN